MDLTQFKCDKTDCYANDLSDNCMLKKRKYLWFCREYYPKVDSNDNDIFQHLFHYHNLKTRKYSVIAITISTIAVLISCYAIVSTNYNKNYLKSYLRDIKNRIVLLDNHLLDMREK